MRYKRISIKIIALCLITWFSGGSAYALSPGINSIYSPGFQESLPAVPDWLQVNTNGFGDSQAGEVTALEAFNGYLYAGIHSDVNDARIYRSTDGVTWTPVTDPGFGVFHDTAPRAVLDLMVFNGQLYASTGRSNNAGKIYRTVNGLNWAPVVNSGFADPDNVDITALASYNGMIYAGVMNEVSGAQIWRSFSGDSNSWTQVAPVVPGTAPAGVTGFAVFNSALYATIESEAPVQIWRSTNGSTWTTIMNNGFGDPNTTSTGGMAVFGGYLYVGTGNSTVGAQLWRSNNGTSWSQAMTPAFSDSNNQKVEAVFVFGNQLYISVKNTITGIEVWRTTDCTVWEQVNLDGFGDSHNTDSNRSAATAEFLSQLYVGTSNVTDGGELWRLQQPAAAGNPSPSSIDYGDQLFRTSNPPATVTVTNNQGSSITLGTLQGSSSVGTTWSSSKSFFIENDTCSGATLSSAADCTFDVKFLPWSLGTKTGTITVPSDAPDQPYVLTLNGKSIAGTQLLLNRSFDNYAVSTGLPNLWGKSPLFKIGIDGVDNSWAFHGPYSVKLVGDGDLKILSQMVNKSGVPGDDFSFFVTTHADGIPNDAGRWLMQVMFYNGSTIVENRNVKLKTGTYDFARITQTYTATTNYTHIMFRIHFGKSSGTAWVDLSSLQWAP